MPGVIGIDPGSSGGVAWTDGTNYHAEKMPATTADLVALLRDSQAEWCYIEKVHASPQMGVVSAFKFGVSAGCVLTAAIAAGLRTELVPPQKWQKAFGLIVKGKGLGKYDTSKKNRNKAKAQELFPDVKMTHAIADALLIAEYGRRLNLEGTNGDAASRAV